MFENIRYLHEHNLDNICMIMDVYLKISDELKVKFEKQVGQILQYYLNEAAAGRVFTIDQFDGKMFNMLCDFGNCFGMCDAGIGNFKVFPNGQIYPCGFLTSNEKYCIGNIKEGIDIRRAKLIAISNFDKNDPKCKGCTIRDFCHGMKCGYMNFVNTGKINVPSDAECIFEHIFYKAMVQILEYYLQQPIEIVREKLGMYIDYIQKENLKFSEFGEKIAQRLSNEK